MIEVVAHTIELHGTMVPKARPKFDGRGRRPRTYMPAGYRSCASSYRQQMRSAWRRDPFGTHRPLRVEVERVVKRPKRRPSWCPPAVWTSGRGIYCPISGGDTDNTAGTVMDAGNGVIWRDDAQIVVLLSSKRYAAADEKAGARVILRFWGVGL